MWSPGYGTQCGKDEFHDVCLVFWILGLLSIASVTGVSEIGHVGGGHRRDSVTALWCIAVLGSICLILEGKVRKTSVPMFQRHQGYRWHFNLHLPCSFSTIQKLGLTKVFFINCATSNHHSNQCLYLCLKYNTGLWYQYHCNSVQHLER